MVLLAAHKPFIIRDGHGLGEEEPLDAVTADGSQEIDLLSGFDPFYDDGHAHPFSHADDGV